MAPFARCVGCGIDTINLSVSYADEVGESNWQRLVKRLRENLEIGHNTARLKGKQIPSSWVFKEKSLLIQEHEVYGYWNWVLTSDLLNIFIARNRVNNIVAQVHLLPMFLWSYSSFEEAIVDVHLFLIQMFGKNIRLQVSEACLCADIAGWTIAFSDWEECFVCQEPSDSSFSQDAVSVIDKSGVKQRQRKRTPTIEFRGRASSLSCRIYNKAREMRLRSERTWFYNLWHANGWDGVSEVWRVEFCFRHEFLQSTRIESPYDLLYRMVDLWEYCTGHIGGGIDGFPDGWLRYVLPRWDRNRNRWPIHPLWEVVQRAFTD